MDSHPYDSGSACPGAERLQEFVQGRLPEDETERIARHLEHCSQCSSLLLTFPETTDSLVPGEGAPSSADATEFSSRKVPNQATITNAPSDPIPPLPSAKLLRLGRYVIRSRLGRGGFGIVYLAHDEWLDRLVAVKVPHAHRLSSPEKLKLYFDEARLHAQVDHPHIVPIYDVNRTEAVPFYQVSKYIPGRNLAELLKEQALPPRVAAVLAHQLADALQHLHERGLVHRDVKPRNILLDQDGQPYLTDFGLALDPLSLAGIAYPIAGTPAYMAPEQTEGGSGRVDARSDIHALGVVLYEMLAGRKPFVGNSEELYRQILHEPPPPLHRWQPDIPRDLEAICLKALAKDPEDRYPTAGDMSEDLRRFLDGARPYLGRTPSRWERWRSALRRRRVPIVLGSAAVLALVLALTVFRRPLAAERPILPVRLETKPPAAEVSFFPLDEKTGRPLPEQVVRAGDGTKVVHLAAGPYLVVAKGRDPKTGKELFHEVYRYVPRSPGELQDANFHNRWTNENGVVRLARFKLFGAEAAEGMCLLGPAEFVGGMRGEVPIELKKFMPTRRVRLPAFHLDTAEVTKEAYRKYLPSWKFAPGEEEFPILGPNWDAAVAFAEEYGKRLPDEWEYEYAATLGGTRRFPWGDDHADRTWYFGPVRKNPDRLVFPGRPPLFGLYSNAAEWTANRSEVDMAGPAEARGVARVVRGGPLQVVAGRSPDESPWLGPAERLHLAAPVKNPGLGFRCARSVRPRWHAADFLQVSDP